MDVQQTTLDLVASFAALHPIPQDLPTRRGWLYALLEESMPKYTLEMDPDLYLEQSWQLYQEFSCAANLLLAQQSAPRN